MRHIIETMMLAITGFVIFICTVVYHTTVVIVRPTFLDIYNQSGIAGKANPIFESIIIYGYIACLVFFIGAILLYLIESHQEEHETYLTYEDKMNRMF